MTRGWGPVVIVLVAAAVWPRNEEPLPTPAVMPAPVGPSLALAAELEADTLALAQVGYGEDPKAVSAVTWVVLNRAGCSVAPLRCREPILREITRRKAFGTTKGGRWRPSWRPDGPAPVQAIAEVKAVLEGRAADLTAGATHFHRRDTWLPPWAPPARSWRLFGSHWFYKTLDKRHKR